MDPATQSTHPADSAGVHSICFGTPREELLTRVFSYLSPHDLIRVSQVCAAWAQHGLKNEIWHPLAIQRWHLPPRRRSWESDQQALSRTWLRSYIEWHRAGRHPGGKFAHAAGTRVIAAACGVRGSSHSSLASPIGYQQAEAAFVEEGAITEDHNSEAAVDHHHHVHCTSTVVAGRIASAAGCSEPPHDGTGCLGVWAWASVMGSDDVRLRSGALVAPPPLACLSSSSSRCSSSDSGSDCGTTPVASCAISSISPPGGVSSSAPSFLEPGHGTTHRPAHHNHHLHQHSHGSSDAENGDTGGIAACDGCRVVSQLSRATQPFTDKLIALNNREQRGHNAHATKSASSATDAAAGAVASKVRYAETAGYFASDPVLVSLSSLSACINSVPESSTNNPTSSSCAFLTNLLGARASSASYASQPSGRLNIYAPASASVGTAPSSAPLDSSLFSRPSLREAPYLALKIILQNVHFGKGGLSSSVLRVDARDGSSSQLPSEGDDEECLIVAGEAHLLLKDGTVLPAMLPAAHHGSGGYSSNSGIGVATSSAADGDAAILAIDAAARACQTAVLAYNGEGVNDDAAAAATGLIASCGFSGVDSARSRTSLSVSSRRQSEEAISSSSTTTTSRDSGAYGSSSSGDSSNGRDPPLGVRLRRFDHAVLRLAFPFITTTAEEEASGAPPDGPAEGASSSAHRIPPISASAAAPRFEPEALEMCDRLRIPVRAASHPHAITHVLSLALPDDGSLWRGYRFVNAHMILRVEPEAAM